MTREEARALLKKHGHKIKDLASYLNIKPDSLTIRLGRGVSIDDELMILGYIAKYDELLQRVSKHRDNPALLALLNELDKHPQS